jgi:predicted RNA binding protein YcfA (HicA-like mRNA interferase family)
MGKRGLPPLERSEVVACLRAAGFALTSAGRNNRHDKYEGRIRGRLRCVPVSRSHTMMCGWLLKSIIAQSGLTKDEFYGMTRGTAAKLGCRFLSGGLPASVRT